MRTVPNPTSVPWSVAEKAYEVYSGRYGHDQSLEHLAERCGFGIGEMDDFLPNWRELTKKADDDAGRLEELRRKYNRPECGDIRYDVNFLFAKLDELTKDA